MPKRWRYHDVTQFFSNSFSNSLEQYKIRQMYQYFGQNWSESEKIFPYFNEMAYFSIFIAIYDKFSHTLLDRSL